MGQPARLEPGSIRVNPNMSVNGQEEISSLLWN
jgi:hypothetical protein